MTPTPDLAAMLRWLGDHGWKPLLYAETRLSDPTDVAQWVCYPQSEVRAWTSVRAADPVSAVRGLYLWALDHPNRPPAFTAAAAPVTPPETPSPFARPAAPAIGAHPVMAMPEPRPPWWSSLTRGWDPR